MAETCEPKFVQVFHWDIFDMTDCCNTRPNTVDNILLDALKKISPSLLSNLNKAWGKVAFGMDGSEYNYNHVNDFYYLLTLLYIRYLYWRELIADGTLTDEEIDELLLCYIDLTCVKAYFRCRNVDISSIIAIFDSYQVREEV